MGFDAYVREYSYCFVAHIKSTLERSLGTHAQREWFDFLTAVCGNTAAAAQHQRSSSPRSQSYGYRHAARSETVGCHRQAASDNPEPGSEILLSWQRDRSAADAFDGTTT